MNTISEINNQEVAENNSESLASKISVNLIKNVLLTFVVLIVVLFSWTGTVDKASETFIDTSLKQAVIVYGTARAINATVSVLQTVSIPGLGLGVGQALDPLNSIVERFSTIMEISIGSLVIQKILIEITTDSFFNILLTISAGVILVSLFFKEYLDFKLLIKLFLSLTFLRYAVVLSLALNGVISNTFIKDKINSEADIITKASTEASSDINKHNEVTKELSELKSPSVTESENSVETQPSEMNTMPPQLPQKKSVFVKFKDMVLGQPKANTTQPSASDTVPKSKIDQIKDWYNKQKKTLTEKLDTLNPMKVAAKIQQIVGNMINLMAIILLQTLLLPIFFMYLMKWIVFAIWNVKIDKLHKDLQLDKQS